MTDAAEGRPCELCPPAQSEQLCEHLQEQISRCLEGRSQLFFGCFLF